MSRALHLLTAALLAAAAALPALPPQAHAQGRFEDKTEAEKAFIRGQRLEDEAISLKPTRPGEAQEHFEDAITAYTEALKLEPGMIDAYVRLGYVYYALEQPDRAIAILKPAAQRWPDAIALKRVYGTILFGQQGRRAEAVQLLEAVANEQKDAEFFDVLFLLGKHYYEGQDNDRAARFFRRYLKERPNDAAIHGTLGNIYFKTEKYEPALAEFRTVLSLDPGNLPARINIANIYFKKEDYPKAIESFKAILKDSPQQHGVRFNLASSLYQRQSYKAALAEYQQFAKDRPKSPAGHYYAGLCHVELKQPAEARDAFQRALKIQPEHARAHYHLALLEKAEKKLDSARALLEKANKLDPQDPWVLIALGDVLRLTDKLPEALKAHQEALRLAPREPAAHESLGRDHFAAQRFDEAVDAFQKAADLDPKREDLNTLLTVALIRRGRQRLTANNLAEAEADATRAATLKGRPLDARLLLVAVALAQNDLPKARGHVDAAIKLEPQHPAVRRADGRLALRLKEGERAVKAFEALLDSKQRTDDPALANDLARAYAMVARWPDALQWFVNARTLGFDKVSAERNIALASIYYGEEESGKERWRQAANAFETAETYRDLLSPVQQLRLDLDLGIAYTETGAFPKALKKLGAVTRKVRSLTEDEKKVFPNPDDLALDLRLAYVHYRVGQLDEAARLLERLPLSGKHARDTQQLLVSTWVRQANALFKAGKNAPAEELLKKAARFAKADPIINHNLAVLDYIDGKGKRVGPGFKSFEGAAPASLFNYAIFLDDIKKDKRGAFDHYNLYIKASGAESEQARRYADAKRRVFGFGDAAP